MSDARAVAYIRVSGSSQADDDKDGLPRQRRAITAYAEAHSLAIERFYEDGGVSGTKDLEHRPGLWQLRQDLISNGTKVVIIERLDRLARDLMISEAIIADFQKHKIEIISTAEPDLCSTEPSRKFIRVILSAMAEYDKATIVAKLNAGRARNRSLGKKAEGKYPYGGDPKRPEEIPVLTFIEEKHNVGLNPTQIARELAAQGWKARSGGNWHPFAISRVLARL